MDDFTAEYLATSQNDDDQRPSSSPHADSDSNVEKPSRYGFRGGLAAFREKASVQDRLVEK
jgi:hypothetical protein